MPVYTAWSRNAIFLSNFSTKYIALLLGEVYSYDRVEPIQTIVVRGGSTEP